MGRERITAPERKFPTRGGARLSRLRGAAGRTRRHGRSPEDSVGRKLRRRRRSGEGRFRFANAPDVRKVSAAKNEVQER
jgi:hypothetical protein